jgi:hypothetical protein
VLLGVEGGGVIHEMLNQGSRFRALVKDLRLAFIDAATAAHRSVPWFVDVHWVPWLQCGVKVRGGEIERHQIKRIGVAYPFTRKT